MTRTGTLRLAPLEDRGGQFLSSHRCVTPRDQEADVRSTICRARCALLAEQADDGSWRGRQQGDASLTARLLLLDLHLDRNHERGAALASAIRATQSPDGGWPARPGGDPDLSVSVLAYLALKAGGASAADADLRAARNAIHRLGGLAAVGREPRFWLGLFEQSPRSPLRGVRELYAAGDGNARGRFAHWVALLRDPFAPLRRPPARDSISEALATRAAPANKGEREGTLDGFLDDLTTEARDGATCELAPGASPLIDTALAVSALAKSGASRDHHAIVQGVTALMERLERAGESASSLELSAALEALGLVRRQSDAPRELLPPELCVARSVAVAGASAPWLESVSEAGDRVAAAVLARRNRDGGWGLARGASAPDVSAVVLLALAIWAGPQNERLAKPIQYLRRTQLADGSWGGAWAAGRVFSTSRAIAGLIATGAPADDPAVEAGANFLLAQQLPSGAWGEGADLARAPRRAVADATASHTAWALEGLVAAGMASDEACCRGASFLLDTQEESGEWSEPHFTLAGERPGAWRRNLSYPTLFALGGLSSWVVAERGAARREENVCIRLAGAGTVEG